MLDADSLVFLPPAKFLRNCPILYLTDVPQQNEIEKGIGYSSQSAKKEFAELEKAGMPRGKIHATYLMNFRPEKGELSAVFWRKDLPIDGYVSWGNEKGCFILDYVYNELKRLRQEIQQSKPQLIICNGKWSLFFLTALTNQKDTAKSTFGTLFKWRASSLELSPWWDYTTPCIVMPVLPLNSKWQLPDKQYLVQWDLKRLGKIAKAAINETSIAEFQKREEYYTVPKGTPAEYFPIAKTYLYKLLGLADAGELLLACDVETSAYSYIDCLGIAWSATEAICIPFSTKINPNFWNEHQEVEVYTLLYQLLLHKNVKHIGQNYAYDMQYFWRNMLLKIEPEHDTMIMNHVLFSTMEKNLGFLSSLYCKAHRWWKDEGKTHKGATDIERWIYNCKDCCCTYEVAMQQIAIFKASPSELQAALIFQTKEVLPAITEVMNNGIKLDTVTRDRQINELATRAYAIADSFRIAVMEEINLNSSLQLKVLFYDLFNCPKQWSKHIDDTGITKNILSLDEAALNILWETEVLIRPFIDLLLDYKRLTKTAGGLRALTLDTDNMLRCSYNICGTDTYRFSSNANAFGTGTNLQVISKGKKLRNGEYLPNSKSIFLPETGYTFFDIDLSAADARIVAAESRCNELLDILESGEDLYTILLREYYRDSSIVKSDPRRQLFKGITHGSNYMGSAAGLAGRFGLLVHDVDRLQNYYFGRFPEIKLWHKDLSRQVKTYQKITNVFGFQRWFFDQNVPTLMQIAAAWKPQSSVAIIINKGMVNIRRNLLEVRVKMQTHDSLAGIFPTGLTDAEEKIKKECSIILPYDRPMIIPVDIHTSTINWGEC